MNASSHPPGSIRPVWGSGRGPTLASKALPVPSWRPGGAFPASWAGVPGRPGSISGRLASFAFWPYSRPFPPDPARKGTKRPGFFSGPRVAVSGCLGSFLSRHRPGCLLPSRACEKLSFVGAVKARIAPKSSKRPMVSSFRTKISPESRFSRSPARKPSFSWNSCKPRAREAHGNRGNPARNALFASARRRVPSGLRALDLR